MNATRWLRIGLPILVLAALGTAAYAQQPAPASSSARQEKADRAKEISVPVRTLEIRDGQVLIDGKHVDAAGLPADLRLDGVQAQFNWVGAERPVVQLGDSYYAVEPGRLVMQPVPLQQTWQFNRAAPSRYALPFNPSNSLIVDPDLGQVYSFSGEPLSEEVATRELARGTDNLYLSALQVYNEALFRKLSSERSLEARAEQLAYHIRTTDDPTLRRQRTDELERLLDDIFELKTRNRLAEIHALEAKLDELRGNLEQRERLKQKMIEARMQQLLGREP